MADYLRCSPYPWCDVEGVEVGLYKGDAVVVIVCYYGFCCRAFAVSKNSLTISTIRGLSFLIMRAAKFVIPSSSLTLVVCIDSFTRECVNHINNTFCGAHPILASYFSHILLRRISIRSSLICLVALRRRKASSLVIVVFIRALLLLSVKIHNIFVIVNEIRKKVVADY